MVMHEDVGEVASTAVSGEDSPDRTILLAGLTSERTMFPEVVGTLDRIMLLEETDDKFEALEDGRLRM